MTPDPHGQAALLLCESFLLLLIEKGLIGREEVADALEGAIEVNLELASANKSAVVSLASIGLLRGVAASLSATAVPDGAGF